MVTYHDCGREVQKDTALFGLEVLGYGRDLTLQTW